MHTNSPYPVSFDGSGSLYLCALFSLIVISSLVTMLGTILISHLHADRRFGMDAVAALRSFVFMVCVVLFMLCVPGVTYMVSYADASPRTLQLMLTIMRAFDVMALVPVLMWMGTFWVWYHDIVLKLRAPTALIWTDSRLPLLKRFMAVVALSAGLAASITIGLAFR